MAVIGEMRQLTIGGKTYTIPTYSLPIASSSVLGGIKVGSGLSIDPSTGTLTATGTSITIDTAMSDSSTNAVQNKVIKSYADGLIAALDGGTIGTPGAGKTLTALSQTNGQVSATFSNISITKSQVSDFPTNVSAFTNDSGYITSYTDEKLKWTASTSSNTYYPLQSTSTATTSTANTLNSVSFYQYYNTAGGYRRFILGNTTAYTSTGGAYGTIRLYGTGATYYGDLNPGTIGANSLTANRTWTLPNATGTIALTTDIPTIPTNVSAFTNDAGYITNAGVTSITTSAGAHSTKSSATGAVSFNVPTKTSHLTNDSGFTTNTGTVTSVAVAGATNSGITISGSPITTSGTITVGLNLSTAINGLGEGTSPAQLNDYAVVQYAGGGTTTTTYHRRKLSNLIVGKAVADQNGATIDTTYLKLAGGTITGPVTFGDTVSIDEATVGDLIVNGASRLIGDTFTNKIQITTVNAPTTSGGSTYGPGSSGQVLKTNGTSIYWDSAGGAGTVTQVTAGTGLKIGTASSGGTITTTGTINHINSVTAQTTQAVYPIKIDAQGHISAYGSAVTIVNTRGTATSGGTTLSVVNTGDMYTWNNKQDKATTLAGYGITDAKIANGTITLGSNTITPLTSFTESDPVFSASAAAGITSSDITNWNGKTSNTGTVTKVTAGTGLKIGTASSGGDITTSGTINHINSVTAQTTQAVYPIKIDAQGHISAYGTAVTIVNTRGTATSGGTTLSVVNTGDMYTWNNKSDTDEKVKQESLNGTNSGRNILLTPSLGTTGTITNSVAYARYMTYNDYSQELSIQNSSDSTKKTTISGISISIKDGTYSTAIRANTPSAYRNIYLPDKNGTFALTADIPTNISSFTNDVGYISSSTTSKIFTQASAPTSGMAAGDIWIDTSNLS